MLETMVKRWWLISLRGLIALVLGIVLLILDPLVAAELLILFIGIYALLDGIFALIVGIINRPPHRDRAWLIAEGIIGILAGIAILFAPLLAGVIIVYFIAFWALLTGILELVFSIAQWKYLPGAWMILVTGIISVLLGGLILANIVAGTVLLVVIVSVYLVIFGLLLMLLGFSLKNMDVDKLRKEIEAEISKE
ncbi:MAG: DUF308 domain-containing protein [Dehalococcoidia bacterium]|nr:DUF308 domain-containing protein [Dehalococcoidia bacterium]